MAIELEVISPEVVELELVNEITIVEVDPYEGSYEATSLISADYELETEGLRMTDNVTIKKIPYEAVSNPQGGKTVTIGQY